MPPLALGSRSQLRMHYYFQPAAGNCQTLLDNVRGAIDPTSTVDISKFPHYMAMPELAAYANSGFPFSRLADLARTARWCCPTSQARPTFRDLPRAAGPGRQRHPATRRCARR